MCTRRREREGEVVPRTKESLVRVVVYMCYWERRVCARDLFALYCIEPEASSSIYCIEQKIL